MAAYAAEQEIDFFVSELVAHWSEGDEYLAAKEYRFNGRVEVESDWLFKEIESYIFNGLLNKQLMPDEDARGYASKILIEDINEYYGLLSSSLNKDGVFHPLLRNPIYKLDIEVENVEKSLYFIIKIENVYVLTYFMKRSRR
ncbi:hypothetical protein ACJJIW_20785 [Microbulbifer sp. JMSA004]|uniref:hypothetical protein n=1 Tax=Microbulbifer sp. JMSA004 TaxID=3243370 RepID=UPI004039A16D